MTAPYTHTVSSVLIADERRSRSFHIWPAISTGEISARELTLRREAIGRRLDAAYASPRTARRAPAEAVAILG
jgi:hypothetical protein